MKLLAFDTSNKTLSLAILDNETLLADITLNIKKNHSVSLMPAIDFLMTSVDLQPKDLNRIVVAQGPGSYTGLRVAVATAKMLAYSLKIDLVGVSSLYALAASTCKQNPDSLVIPLIDARRNNVYVGYYRQEKLVLPERHASLTGLLDQLRGERELIFVGEVAPFAEQILDVLPQAEIIPTLPSAYECACLGFRLEAVNVTTFVPNYLKRVEAEENWLKEHQASDESQYIKRV
ncbi:tRNA (adenosine(37)-N6)-threonylcarbamoyltransferase complex dimerization subunit type 1 TsaB [Streptococcus castoreus]|uniref:tRNA (adenosine(37)-N6)-threonylcarbamoyltransferase complex dimerization subunit type 1 TsaB n=1 Tax=Streptococcus castoreus TaxID=254786 RepID=UPI0003FC35EC|nr:tRNA (adenosine(37)-N6)-threonylcarbamoyltransferase complex dimerization subunit type 1 TsaB [Streptococcus castoreus]